eukprot:CAMPEP_0194070340 /NCGR_PEP_ID=MMETSP0009_2-20130614/88130_1 /TAXON_ID=210454 /ORGANISM="Grammatophora oceanica, Strain CCMP 410" /LENGTH=615 /DNA_ID=CAMNT_0038723605 /DNA_START=271 /DNA_END=2118 /DNA_ORIENTATION=+
MSIATNLYKYDGRRRRQVMLHLFEILLCFVLLMLAGLPFASSAGSSRGIPKFFAFQRALHRAARREADSPRPNSNDGFILRAFWEEVVGEDGLFGRNTTNAKEGGEDDEDKEKGDDDDDDRRRNATIRRVTNMWQRRGERGWELVESLATRLLSPESARAVKSVRSVITQLSSHHGVENVFRKYPPKDLVYAILALGKLQRAAEQYRKIEDLDYYYPQKVDSTSKRKRSTRIKKSSSFKEFKDMELLKEIAYFAVYANAAYGWTLDLALSGRVNLGDLETLLKRTGLKEEEVIAAEWESKTHRPAFFLVRDVRKKKLVLCIRGTLSARDLLTDLCCTAEEFRIEDAGVGGTTTRSGNVPPSKAAAAASTSSRRGRGATHRAHHGMLESARGVAEIAEPFIEKHMKEHPGEGLVIVGHSMGGGVAALLGTLWERKFKKLVVYGYGSPCVGVEGSKPTRSSNIISVVGEGDPFSCLSLGHVADISTAIGHLCEDKELRHMIFMRTDGSPNEMYESDLQWCAQTMDDLHATVLKGEKMYPPGRILFLRRYLEDKKKKDTTKNISVRECTYKEFRDLRLHPRMMDVSRHVPTMYEKLLQDMIEDEKLEKEFEGEHIEFF